MKDIWLFVLRGVTVIVQFVVAYLLAYALLIGLSIVLTEVIPVYTPENPGGGWLSTLSSTGMVGLGAALGTWLVGWAGARLPGQRFDARRSILHAALGAFVGMLAIWLTPPTGMAQFLYPVAGALAGYWLLPPLRRKLDAEPAGEA